MATNIQNNSGTTNIQFVTVTVTITNKGIHPAGLDPAEKITAPKYGDYPFDDATCADISKPQENTAEPVGSAFNQKTSADKDSEVERRFDELINALSH